MHPHLSAKARSALEQIERMEAAGWAPAQSIARQLPWCVAFASGLPCEERPGPFSMGLIATRELDMYGDRPALASLVNEVEREVEAAFGRSCAEPSA